MKTKLFNQSGEIIGDVDLPDKIFSVAMNIELVKQVIDAQTANSRQVIAHTKDRSEVRGGGRKPWRQKGTGRARHASIRSPIWRHGGVAFGPTKERNFEKKINKKTKRKALFMALSSKVKDRELLVLDALNFETPKTKVAANALRALSSKLDGYRESKKKRDSILLVTPGQDKIVFQAVNNLPFAEILPANSLNIRDVLAKKYMILLKDAIPMIEKTFRLHD
ncbi:MAG: 50S ribosomal protein L4 [Candidatus Yanofskybacteria bacterium]|nr:50S ribosomal protein L4 [Candidatus Yanofskybacteria bacterium]